MRAIRGSHRFRNLVLSATVSGAAIVAVTGAPAAETAVDGAGAALVAWTVAATPPLTLPALAAAGAETLVAPAPAGLDAVRDRVVVVHFFATWCEPCREELASLSRLVRRRPDDITVLAVDVGEVPVRVHRFLAAAPVDFPVLIDADRQAAAAWGVRALPTSFVLGRGLAPRGKVVGDLDWSAPPVTAALAAAGRATAVEADRSDHPQRGEEGEAIP